MDAMPPVVKKIDAVFEGGGVKGIGLVGALSVIERHGYEFVNVAGTSAGAIVAALIAAGYTAAELKEIIGGLDFNRFKDTSFLGRIPFVGPAFSVLRKLGIYKGDYFLNLMCDLLRAKKKRTFADLVMPEFAAEDRYRYKLRVVASDVTRRRLVVLPQDLKAYGLPPEELDIALAVRMSMSIPFFFRPVKVHSEEHGKCLVVDGGLLSNFPIDLFDSPGVPEWPTFGFRLVQTAKPVMEQKTIRGPISLFLALFNTAMEAHDARYIETHDFVRTIGIDSLHLRATQFDLTEKQKEALYESGIRAAEEFLKMWDFEAYKALFRSGVEPPSRREMAMGKA